ncbi:MULTISPECIES: FMN-binding protein [Terrisporobacter]|uniref:FMN-binding protein n=1 Tax=Terrisporobacter othiniensis TaxID=1577792 RepID=A0A0B3WV14_9FIRM|nr:MULTISPECIES: FMN-binding protein [Terrisporobacter]KHS58425.1 FMN-binding protein [Terrisporobacter othiniensis]MCC3669278.1 FMN-binding protein [Terrisporobacter mayombei]MDU6983696.1 FMN-binding protein [Terrisporobacter othiniensis]MDY3374403.1 FMN-binding protein [Terrisporobacter othiniensis]
MTLFFNILFAWIALISGILLSIIWLLRIVQKKIQKDRNNELLIKIDKFLRTINKFLRKNHINLGYLFLLSSFIHGMLSSYSIISFNYGTIALIIGLLLWHTFVDKKNMGKVWIQRHRELTALLIIITVLHIFEVGGFVGFDRVINSIKSDFSPNISTNEGSSNSDYKDGVYEGTGYGYGPDLKVLVTIKDGIIDEISIVSHNEVGERFYEPAFDSIPEKIIENQTYDVDAVSGSTYSSKGVIDAVKDALLKAKK